MEKPYCIVDGKEYQLEYVNGVLRFPNTRPSYNDINQLHMDYGYGKIDLDNPSATNREDDQKVLHNLIWPVIKFDHLCHDHWRHSKVIGQPTYQPGDHVSWENAYSVGLINYIEREVYNQLREIYPTHQDSRPFPKHEPMEYGIFVGQIIDENNKPVGDDYKYII